GAFGSPGNGKKRCAAAVSTCFGTVLVAGDDTAFCSQPASASSVAKRMRATIAVRIFTFYYSAVTDEFLNRGHLAFSVFFFALACLVFKPFKRAASRSSSLIAAN